MRPERMRRMTALLVRRRDVAYVYGRPTAGASAAFSSARDVIPELREDAVQVRADRAMREEQLPADLAVRQALRRELCDLHLLRRQLITRVVHTVPAAFPRRAQLAPRLLPPRAAPECVERVARRPQNGPRFGDTAPAPEPLAVRQLDSCALERPAGQVARQRLVEAIAGVRRIGEQRPGMTQTERDPRAREIAGVRLDLGDA